MGKFCKSVQVLKNIHKINMYPFFHEDNVFDMVYPYNENEWVWVSMSSSMSYQDGFPLLHEFKFKKYSSQ